MIQTFAPTYPDRLDDYKIEMILERQTLGPLRKVSFEASAEEKAEAVEMAVQGFYRTVERYGLDA